MISHRILLDQIAEQAFERSARSRSTAGDGAMSDGAGAKADQRGEPPAPRNCDCD